MIYIEQVTNPTLNVMGGGWVGVELNLDTILANNLS